MTTRTPLVQAKAQRVLGLFLGFVLSAVTSCAWAQFDKTAWPNQVVTPNIEAVDLQGKAWSNSELAG